MRRAVIVTMDGLRRDFINEALTPNLIRFAAQAEAFPDYSTVFPSCTRVVSASMATGCHPARHGLQGNSVALMEDGHLVVHDAGKPEFLEHKRRVTGHVLRVPTLAERVKHVGGAIIFSNVSPGAAYMHDPDGHGHVYHRAGSFGPGRKPVAQSDRLDIALDVAGERTMTDRFVNEVLFQRQPALAVLWFGEPDHIQHEAVLGSPQHLSVLAAADRHAALGLEAGKEVRRKGDDVLLFVGSDHGHQTVTDIIDIDAELVAAGLKSDIGSDDIVSVSNGTSSLIYVSPNHVAIIPRVYEFLKTRHWVGELFGPDELDKIGHAAGNSGLTFAVSMRASDACNEHGIPGTSFSAKPAIGKPDRVGCGQHGGLGRFEQSPFLLVSGREFGKNTQRPTAASVIDIAPTILAHLGLPMSGIDGRALQGRPSGR